MSGARLSPAAPARLPAPAVRLTRLPPSLRPAAPPRLQIGGLGDVVTALGRAVQEEGHQVEVILPR